MLLDKIAKLISDKEPTPNKFTIAMGRHVRQARIDAGISQVELARQIYRRQATISDIENGKSEISAGTIMLLAASLDKPVSYFFPRPLLKEIKMEDLDPDEQELIIQFRMIHDDQLREIALSQVKLLADTDYKNYQSALRDKVIKLPPHS